MMKELEDFFKQYPIKKIKKGEVVLQQSEIPHNAYAVKKGIIKVYNLTHAGEEKSLSFKVENDMFPVCWIFSRTTTPLFYYEAHTDCELYVVPREDIMRRILKDARFSWHILDKQVAAYVNSEFQVEALEQSRATSKILYTLRYLSLMYGEEVRQHRVKIKVPLTQQELANFIGLTRETAVSELNSLKDKGVILTRGKFYIINTDKLNNLIDDEYDPGVKPTSL